MDSKRETVAVERGETPGEQRTRFILVADLKFGSRVQPLRIAVIGDRSLALTAVASSESPAALFSSTHLPP